MMFHIYHHDVVTDCECQFPNNLPKEAWLRKILVQRMITRYEADYGTEYPYSSVIVDDLIKSSNTKLEDHILLWECGNF